MGRNILVLEDNLDISMMLVDILTADGYTCFPAYNVDDAETIIDQEALDLALLDMNLPGRSGLEALNHIRQHPERRKTPTIVLTANPYFQQEAERIGTDLFLVKPLHIATLRTMVERCLRVEA